MLKHDDTSKQVNSGKYGDIKKELVVYLLFNQFPHFFHTHPILAVHAPDANWWMKATKTKKAKIPIRRSDENDNQQRK